MEQSSGHDQASERLISWGDESEDKPNSTNKAQPFSDQVPQLLTHHFDQLLHGSSISVDVIRQRNYKSILGKKELLELGFSPAQARVPGILIPLRGTDGKPAGWQYRPDHPRVNSREKPIKYENAQGTSVRLDCPPACLTMISNPDVPVFFVEGVKKADSLASRECCAVALAGVWGLKGKNPLGGITLLADFDYIALKGRVAYICFDSDYRDNVSVQEALHRLAEHLRRKGAAEVKAICLPSGTQDGKVGVDDFLAQGHTIEEVLALAVPIAEAKEEEEEREIPTAYFVYADKLYLEVVRFDGSYGFAYLSEGGKVSLIVDMRVDGRIIHPRPLPEKEGKVVEFVGLPDENITVEKVLLPDELQDKIKSHIRKYADLEDLDLELCTYYIPFTWFYPKVNTLGYLRLLSDTGKGKTRIQKVVGDLCFYPMYASGASSFSGTARQADKWRGTLIIDESDLGGDKEGQFIKYLNLGFEKDKYYVLSDKMNPKHQEFFNPFCPKVLAMREPFNDNATESRLLSISPHETSNINIPIILPSEYFEEMHQLRNQLALFTLCHWNDVDGEKMLSFNDLKIEPRLKQLAMPLSIIFQLWPEGAKGFREYLTARQGEIKRIRSQSWVGTLVNLVIAIATGDTDLQEEFAEYYRPNSKQIETVTPSMVAKQLKSSVKTVTQGLMSVGFRVEQRWIDLHKDKTTIKKQVRSYRVPNSRMWKEITDRYWYDEQGLTIEIPEILRSKQYVVVCAEASQPSQPSQASESVTDVTDETGTSTRDIEKVKAVSKFNTREFKDDVVGWEEL